MERLRLLFVSALFVAFVPQVSLAAVVINEVMYNPQGTDTGREWVELYNTGASDVTLVAGTATRTWRIQDGSGSNALHSLTDPASGTGRGSLVVPAGGYLLIASDPNNFISGDYSGGGFSVIKSALSLSNTGATITLVDQTSGSAIAADSVTYANTQGGNDDTSSLQRQSDGSWIAALPTPGAANSTTAFAANNSGGSSSGSASTASSTASGSSPSLTTVSSYVPPPVAQIFADGGDDRTVIVGADTLFEGEAYNRDQDFLDNARFNWNFGDGSTGEGENVLHHFSYPGKYAVMLSIAEAVNAASDEIIVTAEPANLIFSVQPDGSIAIQNNAGRDINISRWIIASFARSFIFPDDTIILTGQTLRVPYTTLGFAVGPATELQYPNGSRAFLAGSAAAPLPVAATSVAQAAKATPVQAFTTTAVSRTATPLPATKAARDEANPGVATSDEIVAATSSHVAAASASAGGVLWWLAACGIALFAVVAGLAAKYMKTGEWNVIEE